jgi:transcriptional regulator with XRE-family HTH domain
MPISPSSSASAAREAIAVRLRELRIDAGLSAKDLSTLCGWHPAKTSRIEHVQAVPSDEDIRVWCRACRAELVASDLIAVSRRAKSMYLEWRRIHRAGMRHVHESTVPLYERTKLFRVYCSNVVPGLIQTPEYATALMSTITNFQGTPDDVAEAVAARMARSHVIRDGEHRFSLLVEESVLYFPFGDDAAMAGQLDYLLSVMSFPRVALGVIPAIAKRPIWPLEAFMMYDDELVFVELLTAAITITAPREIVDYARAFAELSKMAVFGAQARALVAKARAGLG